MQQADDTNPCKKTGPGAVISPELTALDNKIATLRKQCEKAEELNKRVQLVNDQVVGWTARIAQKIDQQFQDNISQQYEGQDYHKLLPTIFEKISGSVIKQIQNNVIDGDDHLLDDEDKPIINLTAFLNDFGNQDFLDKNVRVRPVSGMTRGDMDETKTNNNLDVATNNAGKSMLMAGDGADDEEKFNRMINLDMEEQRKNIKLKRDEAIRRKQLEEEKKAKKKNKD